MSQTPRPKITVEDLLRVKRAERPAPEFWNRFESELRAKQLAAIVEKPVGWRVWLESLLSHRLVLGSVAACAVVSIFAVRQFTAPASVLPAAGPVVLALRTDATAPVATMDAAPLEAVPAALPSAAVVIPEVVSTATPVAAPAPLIAQAEAPAAALGAVALPSIGHQESTPAVDTLVASAIPERVVLPELTQAVLSTSGAIGPALLPVAARSDRLPDAQAASANLVAAVGLPGAFGAGTQANANVYARPMPLSNKIRPSEFNDLRRRLNSM